MKNKSNIFLRQLWTSGDWQSSISCDIIWEIKKKWPVDSEKKWLYKAFFKKTTFSLQPLGQSDKTLQGCFQHEDILVDSKKSAGCYGHWPLPWLTDLWIFELHLSNLKHTSFCRRTEKVALTDFDHDLQAYMLSLVSS